MVRRRRRGRRILLRIAPGLDLAPPFLHLLRRSEAREAAHHPTRDRQRKTAGPRWRATKRDIQGANRRSDAPSTITYPTPWRRSLLSGAASTAGSDQKPKPNAEITEIRVGAKKLKEEKGKDGDSRQEKVSGKGN